MSQFKFKKERGFIQIILIVVGALVLLKYIYDIDIVGFLTQGRFKELLDRVYDLGTKGWEKYSETLIKLWDYIINFVKNIIAKVK
ncbi:MAG: hypothetical protein A3A96_00105 [Candidatus Zambryskibacteria bacterium RIFCSPLOWO2_01_FULL_39_39]|uniref:Uncharacterized protein n=1 Tax=Candidatus Zambryskibacteria bacterium RIFCSPLOWO2_01_FULL_39_39 TaxID=1802758 RepID=A0A1G2TYX4_9BACT|nr:MAG: hypothetical protein UT00_C0001G0081 [Parcubacteria group bacterium GW2011_GWA1_38_7]OHA87471.1 MAG: hypothetical protein A2644_02835 [Candidatus Zambryskibacteria bacterium RIFCSPHIGHO2_01_FULL_39_63]OHA94889.1 MAG: hypothetical protein A3B88_00725 [Candidatus Zambryskibacteria bacterium RIFCSPHIGHO2_02_FULL_39_19]OHA99069.1 MAG: hypothetical protein A3F20_02675 [Candidatus Zambryskibacteria bacterium RIFCSPHIGHO2_12_FULL_39_21]OHB01830.1 MAG: hypothetical protein A3A96_00105 [Candidat